MTTYTLTREDTGEHLSAYQIRNEAARLDGAATDGLPVPWVAKTPANITPAHTCATCGGPETGRTERTTDSELPARSWARLSGARQWPQVPHDALTAHGYMEAEYDSAHQQIQDLRDLAFWAEQEQLKTWSAISDDYRTRRAAMEARYDREIGHLHAGLDRAPYWAYVQALPDYVRGNTATVASGRHASVYAELSPENIQAGPDEPPPPEHERQGNDPDLTPEHERQPQDRAALDRLKQRVPTVISAGPTAQVGASGPTSNETAEKLEVHQPEGTVRASRWARVVAWIGGAR